jgi:RNA polymerase sigma-70 factor (ECF subfamily)
VDAPAQDRVLDPEEQRLVEALRNGDEDAFMLVVERYGPSLLRVALLFVPSRAVAEEVVQETWLAVLAGIDRFEGRSSFKTWLFRILTNRAKTRGVREARSVPFSALAPSEAAGNEPAVDPERFLPAYHPTRAGAWATPPSEWTETPEERLLGGETRRVIEGAIAALPPAQRAVITLRDVEGWPSEEVVDALGITDGNQRVLLHRARSRVRAALDEYLEAA